MVTPMAKAKKIAAKSIVKANTIQDVTAKDAVDWQAPRFENETFCIVGEIHTPLKHVEKLIHAEGGRLVDDVTETLNYLVVGDPKRQGSKFPAEKTAEKLNKKQAAIRFLTSDELLELFVPDRDRALAMLKAGEAGIERWNLTCGGSWVDVRVDLRNSDLCKVQLVDADLRNGVFDGSDFEGATLDGANFDKVTGCSFDGARLARSTESPARIMAATGCTFRCANIDGIELLNATRCDLSGAVGSNCRMALVDCVLQKVELPKLELEQVEGCHFTDAKIPDAQCLFGRQPGNTFDGTDLSNFRACVAQFPETSFSNANLQEADLSSATLDSSSFAGANLQGANLSRASLQKADLKGASLKNADLSEADLSGSDLSNADLSGANLIGANLSGAVVAGARFRNAELRGANFDNVYLSPAQQFLMADSRFPGKIGPNALELQRIASQSGMLASSIEVIGDNRRFGVHVNSANGDPISEAMLAAAKRSGVVQLLFETAQVKISKGPVKGSELLKVAIAAWCEVFDHPAPAEHDVKEAKKAAKAKTDTLREQALDEIRGGKVGIAKWNARNWKERKHLGKFRKCDLNNVDLTDADLSEANFEQAQLKNVILGIADNHISVLGNVRCNFSKADLTGARLFGEWQNAKFTDACLNDAKFTAAEIRSSTFVRASFDGADISSSHIDSCNLCGTNLKTARLRNVTFEWTKFDEQTSFPDSFSPDDGLVWAGKGKDPRLLAEISKLKQQPSIDFEDLVERLAEAVDGPRLEKALEMLKAESFQLYSDVDDESVTGIVKSQHDANLVYSCRLDSSGTFACCTQNLNPCGGLRGALCKHLVVLLIGLTKAGRVDSTTVSTWVAAAQLQKPTLDKTIMSDIFLKYKGAEAGEIDWRPTETVPEDYYAY
jgi:uncharacterized protein YjbI with pentapeptide repeats